MLQSRSIAQLHTHSEFSLLDGLRPVETMVELAAKRRSVKSMAITDHGSIAGIPSFVAACEKFGIKPILGVEAYFTPDARIKDKSARWFGHITILARNKTGYENLVALVTDSNREEHFYYKARVDWAMLEKWSEGLIVLTGCPGGILPKAIQAGVGMEVIDRLQTIFGENLYGEVHYHDLTDAEIDSKVRTICALKGIPVVCANDAHYPMPSDADMHPLLVAMSTGSKVDDPKAFKIDTRELYLKNYDEMLRDGMRNGGSRGTVLRELAATNKLADEIENYDISREVVYPVPDRWAGKDAMQVLRSLVVTALIQKNFGPEHDARAEMELGVIERKGFAEYFLVLADLCEWVHANDIVIGPGRGSAAASLVLFLLNATGIDPMKYPVMKFERFLNEARIDEPDFDLDVASHHREALIKYLEKTYGSDRVARLGTYTTYAAKMLVNSMAKALGADVRRVTVDVLPSTWNAHLHDLATAKIAGDPAPEPQDPALKVFLKEIKGRLADITKKTGYPATRAFFLIAGQIKNMGTHAAAIILSDKPLNKIAPLVRVDKKLVVGYSASTNRSLYVKTGLLKLDVLGVRTLESLAYMLEGVGEKLDWDGTDYNDQEVLKLYRNGDLTGIFQFESGPGIIDFTKQLSPESFADVYTIMALWRPGPLRTGMSKKFIQFKKEGARELHPLVDKILESSRGMMVFQEDLIHLYSEIADSTPAEADLFRRDIIKQMTDSGFKKRMQNHRARWFDGCKSNDIKRNVAERLWREMLSFAKYGFNAPHAVCYGAIGYQQMRIKAKNPGVFVAASLAAAFHHGRAQAVIMEAARLKVSVKPPNVLISGTQPVAHKGSVYLHLESIKGVGAKAVAVIVAERERGQFKSVEDFRERVPRRSVNKNVFAKLLLIGAFQGMNGNSAAITAIGGNPATVGNRESVTEALGIILDMGIPEAVFDKIKSKCGRTEKSVVSGGLVTGVRPHKTRKGLAMGFLSFIGVDGHSWEAVIWPSLWRGEHGVNKIVSIGDLILVKGRPDEMPHKVLANVLGVVDKLGNFTAKVKQPAY